MVGAPASPQRGQASAREGELSEAYAACAALARSHYENFPVASRLVPPALRPHVAAIYAFARTADDIADEPGLTDAERLRLLDLWERALMASASGDDRGLRMASEDPAIATQAAYVFQALPHTIHAFDLPLNLFTDLLSAFRQDVKTSRYETWADVFDYCRRSANPVGRLVLRLAGVRDEDADRSSDALCTALQLTNFWQDLAIDWRRGRLYVPAEEYARAGARLSVLDTGRMDVEWRDALAAAAGRTSALFDTGRDVCDAVTGRLRYELRATWLGGRRILDRLAAQDFDVFSARPALGARDLVVIGWRAAVWPRSKAEF